MLDYLLVSAALVLGQGGTAQPESPPVEAPAAPVAELEAAPAPEEPAAAPPPVAADRWLLMKSLQGTWPGALLDGHRMQVTGWVAGSYTASSASGTNLPLTWNDKADEFLLQQFWVRLERSVVTSGTTEPTFGFRSDWLIGSDYRFTLPRGIFNGQLTENDGFPNNYGIDPIAFYGEAYFPTVANGLDIRVGRFFTPFGVESLEAVSTPLVSRSYAFNNAPPFTHTGLLATLKLTSNWTVQAGPVLGNDIFIDPAAEARFVGTLQWRQSDGRNAVAFGTSVGRGRFDLDEAQNHINVFDVVYTHTFNPVLNYTFESIVGYQTNVPGVGTAHWYSVVNYLTYVVSPRLTGITRLEAFDDVEGTRTGFEGLYTAWTVGLTFRPRKGLSIRPELRYDYNHDTPAFEGKHWLVTAATDVILRW